MYNFFGELVSLIVICLFVMVLILTPISCITCKYKAEAYNKVTGSNVTAWDVFWLDLRVQSEPKEPKP